MSPFSSSTQGCIIYGSKEIRFVKLESARKNMSIEVHPDKSVLIKVPTGTKEDLVLRKLYARASWLRTQQRFFEQFEPRTQPRFYVAGESHLYLGKVYRLKIEQRDGKGTDHAQLRHGYLRVTCSEVKNQQKIKALVRQWFMEKAHCHCNQIFDDCWERVIAWGKAKPKLAIRHMKTRWGSLSPLGTLTLNSALIHAPWECIEYVIMHEMCHLQYGVHDKEFYRLLTGLVPNWKATKLKLEQCLA